MSSCHSSLLQSCIDAHASKCGSDTQGLAMTTLFAKVMEVSTYNILYYWLLLEALIIAAYSTY